MVFGVVAVATKDVVASRPTLSDLLLGVGVTVPDGVRLADRLGGGAGTRRGATPPTVAGVTVAEVIADSAVLPVTEVEATPAGDAGRFSAVVEPILDIRKIAPAMTATTVTTPPTATEGATRVPALLVTERTIRRGAGLGGVGG